MNYCVEAGFVWSDILTDLERVADHCSNVSGCYQAFALDPKSLRKKALIYKAFRDINNIRGYLRGMSLRMKLIERIEKTELGHRILRDLVFRLFITASVSMGWKSL